MYIIFAILVNFVIVGFAFAHGMSVTDQQRILQAGFPEFCWLGAKHMITGYDHLLFLFGVIFFLTKFRDIVKFVTAFTIGHSITLIFATFLGIKANYFLIDAVIALTVMYKGFDNIGGFKKYLNINPRFWVINTTSTASFGRKRKSVFMENYFIQHGG